MRPFNMALATLALACVAGVSGFAPAPLPGGARILRRRAAPLRVAMEDEHSKILGSTPAFPRLPPMDLESGQRVRLAEILQKSTVLDLLSQQVTDAVQDIGYHVGRDVESALIRFAKKGEDATPGAVQKKKLVVLGAGWGAHALVKVIDTDKFDVVAVSPRPYFIFTPMLAASSVGTVEYRSISEPMRASNPFIDCLQAEATKIDTAAKTIRCRSVQRPKEEFTLPYDYLVTSVGVQSATFGVPGVRENCCFLKSVDDAIALRSRLVAQFEAASLPNLSDADKEAMLTFVVVGGGPTGVEFSGELFDFLRQDVRRYYPKLVSFVRTKLIQSGPSILEAFDQTMQVMALDRLKEEGNEVILKARVKEVTEDTIRFSRATEGGGKQDEETRYGLCVWAAGNAPLPICLDLIKQQGETPAGKLGRIEVDPWQRMTGVGDGSVFAVGDCAACETGALPQTAQVAGQQGAYVARLLNREADVPAGELKGGEGYGWEVGGEIAKGVKERDPVATALKERDVEVAKPFEFLSLGILAYIGGNQALAQVDMSSSSDKEGTQKISFRRGGWAGWVLWRSVYLTKQVAFRNRVLVLFDWVKSRVFGRDIACL